MLFFKIFKQLEVEVSFFNYYRQFIHYYAMIAEFLNHFKTVCLQSASWKEKIRKQYIEREILQSDWSLKMIALVDAAEET